MLSQNKCKTTNKKILNLNHKNIKLKKKERKIRGKPIERKKNNNKMLNESIESIKQRCFLCLCVVYESPCDRLCVDVDHKQYKRIIMNYLELEETQK